MKMKERDANMDLMRITAMLLVMLFHINYYNIAMEEGTVATYSWSQTFSYSLMKCFSTVCVNMFVLISGWYGIKPTFRKLAELTFQIWFFSIPMYLCLVFLYDDTAFSLNAFLHLFIFRGYWFVHAYLLLYVCSPIFNTFVKNASQRTFLFVLMAYLVLMFLYGWKERAPYFNRGCSPLVFFALYLTARYMRLHPNRLSRIGTRWLAASYLLLLLVTSFLCTFATRNFGQGLAEMLTEHTSPLNIGMSVLLLLLFSRLRVQSWLANSMGVSCLSAYLLHASPLFYEKIFYPLGCYSFRLDYVWQQVAFVVVLIGLIFILSIMLDKIRIALWGAISRSLFIVDGYSDK